MYALMTGRHPLLSSNSSLQEFANAIKKPEFTFGPEFSEYIK